MGIECSRFARRLRLQTLRRHVRGFPARRRSNSAKNYNFSIHVNLGRDVVLLLKNRFSLSAPAHRPAFVASSLPRALTKQVAKNRLHRLVQPSPSFALPSAAFMMFRNAHDDPSRSASVPAPGIIFGRRNDQETAAGPQSPRQAGWSRFGVAAEMRPISCIERIWCSALGAQREFAPASW